MSKRNVIKLSLSRLSIPEVFPYVKKITTKMATAPAFTTLVTKAAAVDAQNTVATNANTSYDAAQRTADALMTARDKEVATLVGMTQDLATASEGVTKDPATLQTGGWEIIADHATPVGAMVAPPNFNATSGDNAGEVDLACDTQYGVQSHVGESAASPDGPFTQFYVGRKSSCTKTGLVSGSLNWFRMAAVGAAGQGPYSGPISKRAT